VRKKAKPVQPQSAAPLPVAPAASSAPSPAPLPVTLEEEAPGSASPAAPNLENPYAAQLREKGAQSQPAKRQAADCAQPYEVDERGIRRIKPACL
jgi:hypothetical protein